MRTRLQIFFWPNYQSLNERGIDQIVNSQIANCESNGKSCGVIDLTTGVFSSSHIAKTGLDNLYYPFNIILYLL